MTNNQLATYTPEIQEAFKPEVIQVMRNSFAPTATDPEFVLFAHKAASYGLDPFKNEIFFIKYGNTARIQFAAEAYLSKAREKEGFQPPDTQMVHENDEFKVQMSSETKTLEIVTHEIGFPRGKVIGAYSIAYREKFRPVTVIMDVEEVEHMFKGQNKDNWLKWTSDMFGKHVQQRALKKQYGLEFGDEEIPQSNVGKGDIPEYKQDRKDITNEAEDYQEPSQQEQPQADPEVVDDPIQKAKNQMQYKFKKLGIVGKDAKGEYINKNIPRASNPPTLAELTGLIKVMDMEIEAMNSSDNDGLE